MRGGGPPGDGLVKLRRLDWEGWRISYNDKVVVAMPMDGSHPGPVRIEVGDLRDESKMQSVPKVVREFVTDAGWPDVLLVMDS